MKTNKRKVNPLLEQKFNEGTAAGYDRGFGDAKRKAAAQFAVRLERLLQLKGIGEKTMERIIEDMQRPLSLGEQQAADVYEADLIEKAWRDQDGK